jgi:Rod binding domain-containing protein
MVFDPTPSSSPVGPPVRFDDLDVPRRADGSADSAAAARKFEGLLVAQLISQMRESSGVKMFGDTPGAQVFEGLFDQMFGEAIAKNGGLGLAERVEASLQRIEKASKEENRT